MPPLWNGIRDDPRHEQRSLLRSGDGDYEHRTDVEPGHGHGHDHDHDHDHEALSDAEALSDLDFDSLNVDEADDGDGSLSDAEWVLEFQRQTQLESQQTYGANQQGSQPPSAVNNSTTAPSSAASDCCAGARSAPKKATAFSANSLNSAGPSERPNATTETLSTAMSTFFNLTKCFVGASSFELPWAFMQVGVVGGAIGLTLFALISYYTLVQLAECGHLARRPKPTFPQIGRESWGSTGATLVWLGVAAMTLGVCGSYFVFIGSTLSSLLAPSVAPWLTTEVCTALVLPVVIAMAFMRSYRVLAPISVLGCIAVLLAASVTIYDALRFRSAHFPAHGHAHVVSGHWATELGHATAALGEALNTTRTNSGPAADAVAESTGVAPTALPIFSLAKLPLFLGNAAYVYLIHIVVLPIEQSMAPSERPRFPLAVAWAVFLVTVLNTAFAAVCAWGYGSAVQGNVIQNIDPSSAAGVVVKILVVVDILFTCALFLFPMTESLEAAFFDPKKFGRLGLEVVRKALRVSLVCLTAGVALLVPFFSLLTGLTGGLGNNVLGFVLPPLIFVKLQDRNGYWRQVDWRRLARCDPEAWSKLGQLTLNLGIVLLGVALLFSSTISFLQEILAGYRGHV